MTQEEMNDAVKRLKLAVEQNGLKGDSIRWWAVWIAFSYFPYDTERPFRRIDEAGKAAREIVVAAGFKLVERGFR